MDNKFLSSVSALIQNKNARTAITAELESHILEKADYYVEIGYSEEEALKRATDEMGEPDDTAVPLNSLHNVKWYKNIWNILTLAFAVVIALLCMNIIPIEHRFHYGDCYYVISRSVTIDFISLMIFAVYVFLLYKSRKRKSLFMSVLILLSLVFMLVLNMPDMNKPSLQFALFQPMLYAVVTIAVQGIAGYADSVFGYGYVPDSQKNFLVYSALALFAVLLLISIFVLVVTVRQQRMKSIKSLQKPLKIAQGVLSFLLAANFAVMACTTVFAFANLDTKLSEMLYAKEADINYVIKADLKNGPQQLFDDLKSRGYEQYYDENNIWHGGQNSLHLGSDYNTILIDNTYESGDTMTYIIYSMTTYDNNFAVVNNDIRLTDSEREGVKDNMTLEEFMKLGWYTKAFMVGHSYDDAYNESIHFNFIPENRSENYIVYFNFERYESDFVLTEYKGVGYEGWI